MSFILESVRLFSYLLLCLAVAVQMAGCPGKESESIKAAPENCREMALKFTRALTRRDYKEAYGMISRGLKSTMSIEEMKQQFESYVPPDWKNLDPVEIGASMESWPDKKPSDRGWVYVSISGDVYCEAVTVIVAEEEGSLVIRHIEFGRP